MPSLPIAVKGYVPCCAQPSVWLESRGGQTSHTRGHCIGDVRQDANHAVLLIKVITPLKHRFPLRRAESAVVGAARIMRVQGHHAKRDCCVFASPRSIPECDRHLVGWLVGWLDGRRVSGWVDGNKTKGCWLPLNETEWINATRIENLIHAFPQSSSALVDQRVPPVQFCIG